MILVCPSCDTRYFADDSSIGKEGRRVRCATCGHAWHAKLQEEGDEPVAAEDTGLTREQVEHVHLMKIDAEGAEVEILETASTAPAAHVVGEFHPWLVAQSEERLRAALTPAYEVEFVVSRRCGAMFKASAKAGHA